MRSHQRSIVDPSSNIVMQALSVIPGKRDSLRLEDISEPRQEEGDVLVATRAIGLCGTDLEIAAGEYGVAPSGRERLVIGHESIGQVIEAPSGGPLAPGDWVVGIVRHPDPVPCACCAVGEWDMCRNGRYTEHGIVSLDGFARERYRSDAEHLVQVDAQLSELGVLLEPTSVVAKAWEQTERIAARSTWRPRRALIIGAGPIGLLAALLGVQRGLDIHVLDRVADGPKPELVRDLGATYHSNGIQETGASWDVIFECTGAPALLFDAMRAAAPDGIVCLTGVSAGGDKLSVDPGALNRELVLENNVIFGSVNANRRHYEDAARALARADRAWLERLVTRRLPLDRFAEAFAARPHDVKTVLTFN
jgi:threonine dehydrogenase-like Zn-dependent dehydrogenase